MSMVRVVFAIGAAACAALLPVWTAQGSGAAPQVQAAGPPSALPAPADRLYFPPADGPWETVDPAAAGWDAAGLDAALALAGDRDSTGVVVLHRGRILAERHWTLDAPSRGHVNGSHGPNADGHAVEDVASVQKSVVAVLVGLARQRGLLALDDPVTDHAGRWTQATDEQNAP